MCFLLCLCNGNNRMQRRCTFFAIPLVIRCTVYQLNTPIIWPLHLLLHNHWHTARSQCDTSARRWQPRPHAQINKEITTCRNIYLAMRGRWEKSPDRTVNKKHERVSETDRWQSEVCVDPAVGRRGRGKHSHAAFGALMFRRETARHHPAVSTSLHPLPCVFRFVMSH